MYIRTFRYLLTDNISHMLQIIFIRITDTDYVIREECFFLTFELRVGGGISAHARITAVHRITECFNVTLF